MSTDQRTETTRATGSDRTPHEPTTFDRYRGNPAEIYEEHFVPRIGLPCAEQLVDAAALRTGERVLDVACGTGVVTRIAAGRVGPTGSVAGVDGHPQMLEVARRSSARVTVDWREASAEGLPFDHASFDAAVCSISLQFFADKVRSLSEMRRVLAPGGRVAIGVPGPTPAVFEVLHDVLDEHVGEDPAAFVHAVFALNDPDHVAELIDAAGFEQVQLHTGLVPLHLAPPADFLWQYMLATPLAGAGAGLDQAGRHALEHAVATRLQPFVVDGLLESEVGLIIATAVSP